MNYLPCPPRSRSPFDAAMTPRKQLVLVLSVWGILLGVTVGFAILAPLFAWGLHFIGPLGPHAGAAVSALFDAYGNLWPPEYR